MQKVAVIKIAAESAITKATTFETENESIKPADEQEAKEGFKRDQVSMARGN